MASLAQILEDSGVERRLVAPLSRYGERVLEANRSFNLTGAKTAEELAPHVLDSLTVLPFVRDRHVDVGSGAGLPGIVIAIASGAAVTLVETTRKKAAFLQSVVDEFSLAAVVVAERAEIAGRDERWRERFSSASARAVAAAPTVAELTLPFLEIGGVAILQRGALDARERTALDDASLVLGGAFEAEHRLDGERRIVLVRKKTATPLRFPRRTGVPEKRPLCY